MLSQNPFNKIPNGGKWHFSAIGHVSSGETIEDAAIKEAFENTDVLLITGGISVGDYDYVKPALEKSGVAELFTESGRNPENLYSSGSLMTNLFLRYREIRHLCFPVTINT